jgi:hypothetical protein
MSEQTLDFWPDIATARPKVTPLSLIKQQAALLGKHTNNLLEGAVVSSIREGRLVHRFLIKVPTLDYSYELFMVSQFMVDLYPVKVESAPNREPGHPVTLESEQEFLDWLKEVLSSEKTQSILTNLLSQTES